MTDVASLVRERFSELTPIQKLAIPRVLDGENVLILSPTGSGKTESVLLPVLEKIREEQIAQQNPSEPEQNLQNPSVPGIRALYITPLRALSRDLKERFEWWCKRLDITHDIRTGDTTMAERARHRKDPPKVLLTTVESLQALLMGRIMRKHLTTVRFVIVDEIHDVLDNKRGAQLSMGLERLAEIAKFQRLGLTATVADESEAARLLFGDRPHAVCEVGKSREMDISVDHSHTGIEERIKEYSEKNRSLIFVNTRSTAEELGATLKKMGAPIAVHHGSLSKELRLATEDEFKSGKVNSILCTSSLELGIDVGDVNLVMQYGSPHQAFRLVQRVGRAGHSLEKTPKGIIFTTDFDDVLESETLCALAKSGFLEDKLTERGALDVIAHQIVGLLLDFGQMQLSKAHSILSRSHAYGIDYEKLRKVALQLFSEGIIHYEEDAREVWIRARPRAREYYYTYLSTIPKAKRFLMKDITTNRVISSLDEEFVVNLESGASFLSHGLPWRIVDITESEVLAEPSAGSEIMVPSWAGEDIPVSYEVAQGVGKMRSSKKDVSPLPDDKTFVVEIVQDLVVIHSCAGTRVNEALSRIYARRLSRLIGESVLSVADPYRIMVKLPFALKEEHIMRPFSEIRDAARELEEALEQSSLLKFKFLHVGRMFGLLSEDAVISQRFIEALRNSAVYEEALRSIFFRYFDVPRTAQLLRAIRTGSMKVVVDKREKPSFFARIGLERLSGGESVGAFAPRERILSAFKENALSKTVRLRCLSCSATRFMHLAGAPQEIACHKCGQKSMALVGKEGQDSGDPEFSAGLIRTYGKNALIALSTYGIGPTSADRILRKLHRDEGAFFLDLIEAQKNFIKNKKFWKL